MTPGGQIANIEERKKCRRIEKKEAHTGTHKHTHTAEEGKINATQLQSVAASDSLGYLPADKSNKKSIWVFVRLRVCMCVLVEIWVGT